MLAVDGSCAVEEAARIECVVADKIESGSVIQVCA